MADIDVVKKGSRVWLWILMLVVLALILWFVMARNNAPQTGSILDEAGHAQQASLELPAHATV